MAGLQEQKKRYNCFTKKHISNPTIKQYNNLTINNKAFSYLCGLMKQQYSNLIAVKFL